jgi:polyhydroxyalkanoate synthesis repressor PhaR
MSILIKRYRNRKLYNTVVKRYITLDDVGEIIRGGSEIVVTDTTTGEDITTHILTQVIAGQEMRGQGILSHGLLMELIKARLDTLAMVKQILQGSSDWEGWLNSMGLLTRRDVEKLSIEIDALARAIDTVGQKDKERGRN